MYIFLNIKSFIFLSSIFGFILYCVFVFYILFDVMKKILLGLLVAVLSLVALGYALPVSPAMVDINNDLFSEEDLPGVCSVF
jgi:hypothetical protein